MLGACEQSTGGVARCLRTRRGTDERPLATAVHGVNAGHPGSFRPYAFLSRSLGSATLAESERYTGSRRHFILWTTCD
jgi:hypothetical protein